MSEHTTSIEDPRFKELKQRITGWLESDGCRVEGRQPRGSTWALLCEDYQGRFIVAQGAQRLDRIFIQVGIRIPEEERLHIVNLESEDMEAFFWDLRFRLLSLDVEFQGTEPPFNLVLLTRTVYLDGMTRNGFGDAFRAVRSGLLAVALTLSRKLGKPAPPSNGISAIEVN